MERKVRIILSFVTVISFLLSYSRVSILPYVYILVWLFIWHFVSLKKAMLFYLYVLLIEGDISKYGVLDNNPFNTIYTTYIGGKSISVLWAIVNFLILLANYIKTKSSSINKRILPFLIIFCTSIIMALTNDSFILKYFISDLSYFINIFVGYLTVILFIKSEQDVISFFKTLSIVLIVKTIIISVDSYFMSQKAFFNVYTVESGSYLFSIVIVYAFLMLREMKASSMFSIVNILTFVVLTASRGRILIMILSLFISSIFAKKIKSIVLFSGVVVFTVFLISLWNIHVYNYFMWKITSFVPSLEKESGKLVAMSSMVRLVEFKNIIAMHLDKVYTSFFGVGFGGYFTSDYVSYPFVLYNTSSYPDTWINQDKFYKPHGTILYALLKYGYIGFLLLFGSVIHLSFSVLKKIGNYISSAEYKSIIISISSFLPFLFVVNFTSKLQIFSGVFFAILTNYISRVNLTNE